MNSKAVAGGIGSVLVTILVIAAVVAKVAVRINRIADRNKSRETQQFNAPGGGMAGVSKEEAQLLKRMEDAKKAALNSPEREMPYLERRASFKTKLTRQVKAPQDWELGELPPNLQLVTYPSGNLSLKAILYVPPNIGNTKRPALVYYHGGFALSHEELEDCEPFVNDDFVVMIPALRGENGGDGNYELFGGELDDAANAVRWLSKHKNVDTENIYAFGHSVGGGVSAMMSLMDDNLPLKHCGGSGGLYDPGTFFAWRYADEDGPDMVPFDPEDANECLMRLLQGNVRWMKRKHYAYIGVQDTPFLPTVAEMRLENMSAPDKTRLNITQLSGDHFTSLEPAVKQYHSIVKSGMRTSDVTAGSTVARTSPNVQTSITPSTQRLSNTTTVVRQGDRTEFNIEQEELGHNFGDQFSEKVPENAYLVGFEVSKKQRGTTPHLVSLQPLYRTKDGEKQGKGKLYGTKSDDVERAFAPKGYAVGGLRGLAQGDVSGFELTFMKINPDGTLDPNDTQTSDWIGGHNDFQRQYSILNGKGKHVSAVSGSIFMDKINSVKLEFESN